MLQQQHAQLAADDLLPREQCEQFKQVRGIVFDAAGVIYDATLWRRNVWQVVCHLGFHVDYGHFFSLWDNEYASCVNIGRREFAEAFEAFLLGAGLSWGEIDEVEAATRASRLHLCCPTKPLPGVVRVLKQIASAGFSRLAFVDAPVAGSQIAACFKAWGIDSSLPQVVTSLDIAAAQPDAASFRAMLELLGHGPDQVAYVSQNGLNLHGAKRAGLTSVALGCHAAAVADARIGAIDELIRLIPSGRHSEAAGLQPEAAALERGRALNRPGCSPI
jgi:FMN phosphatase YigB (HAD superfamily)